MVPGIETFVTILWVQDLRMCFLMLLGFRLGLNETFLWKMRVIVLEHLYICYVEYRLNTRVFGLKG